MNEFGNIILFDFEGNDISWQSAFLTLCNDANISDDLVRERKNIFYVDVNSMLGLIMEIGEDVYRETFKDEYSKFIKKNSHINNVIWILSGIGEGRTLLEMEPIIKAFQSAGVPRHHLNFMLSLHLYNKSNRVRSFDKFFFKYPFSDNPDGMDLGYFIENGYDVVSDKYSHDSLNLEKEFLILTRRMSKDRFVFYNNMFSRLDWITNPDIVDMSFGVCDYQTTTELKDILNELHGSNDIQINRQFVRNIPYTFDSEVVDSNLQHDFLSTSQVNQLINVIVETNISGDGSEMGSIFITEKSIKPFYYFQLPVWVGQPGIVNYFRELGFDVFDDFFNNHEYDNIPNHIDRINEVVKLLDVVHNKLSSETLEHLKYGYRDRLQYNFNLAKSMTELSGTYNNEFRHEMDKIINNDGLNGNVYSMWDTEDSLVDFISNDKESENLIIFSAEESDIYGDFVNEKSSKSDIQEITSSNQNIHAILSGRHNYKYDKPYIDLGINLHRVPLYWLYRSFVWMSESMINFFDESKNECDKDKLFVNFNNKSHSHRCDILDMISKYDLFDSGIVSWLNQFDEDKSYDWEYWNPTKLIVDDYGELDFRGQVHYDIIPSNYYSSVFSLIGETSTSPQMFITEKTWMPLLMGRPVIIMGAPGIHEYLRQLGFELHENIIDYSFDTIYDDKERAENIISQLKSINRLDYDVLHSELRDSCNHNTQILKTKLLPNWKSHISDIILDVYNEGLLPDDYGIKTIIEFMNQRY